MKKTLIVLAIVLIAAATLAFTYPKPSGKWTQPKFVKEWEVRKFVRDPENRVRYRVVDITANKYGVFALVEAGESKNIPAKKWAEYTDEERLKSVEYLDGMTGRKNDNEETFNKNAHLLNRYGDIYTYQIQHFDLNGNYINAWPNNNALQITDKMRKAKKIPVRYYNRLNKKFDEFDSRNKLVMPLRIISDDNNDLCLADYAGNKIVVFDRNGDIKNTIAIDPLNELYKGGSSYEELSRCKGFVRFNEKLQLIYKPFESNDIFQLAKYKISDGTKNKNEYPLPKIRPYISFAVAKAFDIKLPPLYKAPVLINDFAVDKKGNYYLLAGMQAIVKYDRNFKKIKSFDVVLKEGFDTDVEYKDLETGKMTRYGHEELPLLMDFDSQKGARFGERMGGARIL